MKALELRIPPLVVLAAALVTIWAIDRFAGTNATGKSWLTALALGGIGLTCMGAGVVAFKRAHTTVDPRDPSKTGSIVSSGIYRFTRNPMYLGMVIIALAATLWFGEWPALVAVAGLAAYLQCFQIYPEERILEQRFGAAYQAYARATRRWL